MVVNPIILEKHATQWHVETSNKYLLLVTEDLRKAQNVFLRPTTQVASNLSRLCMYYLFLFNLIYLF